MRHWLVGLFSHFLFLLLLGRFPFFKLFFCKFSNHTWRAHRLGFIGHAWLLIGDLHRVQSVNDGVVFSNQDRLERLILSIIVLILRIAGYLDVIRLDYLINEIPILLSLACPLEQIILPVIFWEVFVNLVLFSIDETEGLLGIVPMRITLEGNTS